VYPLCLHGLMDKSNANLKVTAKCDRGLLRGTSSDRMEVAMKCLRTVRVLTGGSNWVPVYKYFPVHYASYHSDA
jgi:hypothetical protein